MLKTIRIKGSSRISLIWSRSVPVIVVVVRGGMSQPLVMDSQQTFKMNRQHEEYLL